MACPNRREKSLSYVGNIMVYNDKSTVVPAESKIWCFDAKETNILLLTFQAEHLTNLMLIGILKICIFIHKLWDKTTEISLTLKERDTWLKYLSQSNTLSIVMSLI
jgi:hypothetical protein